MDEFLDRLLRLAGFGFPAALPGEPLASALLEAAFLVAVADDVLSSNEDDLLAAAMTFVRGGPVDLDAELERLNEARSHDGVDGRFAHIGSVLESADERARVLRFAAVVALCDQRVVPREHGTLLKLGKALGFSPEDVLRVTSEVREMTLGGGSKGLLPGRRLG